MPDFKKVRLAIAWIVGLYLAQMYLPMGVDKFDPTGFWAEPFERWGYPIWLRLGVGVIETVGAVAILVPWIASWGGIAVAAVMAGAWFTRLGSNPTDVLFITAYIAALLWIAYEWWSFRRPKLFAKAAAPAANEA